MPLKHHNFTALRHQTEANSPAPTPCKATFRAHLSFTKLFLRACLVSNRVGLGGAKFASPTRRTAPCGLLIQGNLLSFRSVSTKESYRDRPFAYARTPKRVNPHPYQTGSNITSPLAKICCS